MKHSTDKQELRRLLAAIQIMEAATFRSQAMQIVRRGVQQVTNAVNVLRRSRFSPSARLTFRARVSGMLRRAAKTVLDLGWQAGGGAAGKAPVGLQQEYMQKQQQHLSRWFLQIRNTGKIPGGTQRAQMYANSLMGLYRQGWEAAQRVTTGLPALPAEPRDGTTICLMNCLCRWVIQKKSNTEYWAFWRVSPVENCPTCLCRAKHWAPLKITKQAGVTPGDNAGWVYETSGGSQVCSLYR